MTSNRRRLIFYSIAGALMLLGVFLPKIMARIWGFVSYSEDPLPNEFFYLQYAMQCVFLFVDISIVSAYLLKKADPVNQ